jgi:DNA-binding MarR family transcriptional regulator
VADRDALISRIMETQRQLRREFADDQAHPLLTVNLTMSQLKIMLLLGRLGGASGQDLARRTGVGLATLTGIVDRLVGQHLVSRREDPRDRRVRRLELTPTGAELVDRVITAGEEHHQRLLQRLDLPDLEIVAHAFDLILGATATPPDAAPPGDGTPTDGAPTDRAPTDGATSGNDRP